MTKSKPAMDIPNKGSLIEVRWIDAFNPDPRWRPTETIKTKKQCVIYTAGYLIDATDDYLIVSRDKAKGQMSGIFHIPMGTIKSVRRLR